MAAEVVLTFAAEGILKKVLSLAQKEFKFAWGFKAELEKLKESFTKIELLLNSVADKPQDPPIEAWVKKLKDVAHDAEDVLDELEYEGYRRKVEIQNHMKKKVLNFFSLSNPLAFRLQMAPKFQKINASLVDLKSEASLLGLVSKNKDATSQGIRWDRQTNSLNGKDEKTFGRGKAVSNIVTNLTNSKNNQENLAVMAIVGMGGLGKTTLAKSVYNEDSIHKFFEKRIWVCVSNTFDVTLILHRMLESLTLTKASSKDNQDAILKKLQEELKDKRYLLVLDDVWNEDARNWEYLMECLSKLNSVGGSKIIVTTRSGKVASISEKLLPRHELGKLSVDECWSIMKDRAFPDSSALEFDSSAPEFEAIGKEIAKHCGGVPLMAKVLGGILHNKKSTQEWSSFKNSRIWNNHSKEEDRIMSILRLSFDNLESPSLKQCFAYCSMFEKDAEIQRDNLIQLWMAQGLLRSSPSGSKDMEDIGNEYFDILLQSSLFQDATISDNGIIRGMANLKCVGAEFYGYDLVHNVATTSEEVITLFPALKVLYISECGDLNEWKQAPTTSRKKVVVFPILEMLTIEDCSKLRNAPSHFPFLQKLEMSSCDSRTPIEEISSGLTTITFLKIKGIKELTCLPQGILKKNNNLSSLDISDCNDLTCITQDVVGSCSSLERLCIWSCKKLRHLPNGLDTLPLLEVLEISECPSLEFIPITQGMASLQEIKIVDCGRLSRLPSGLKNCTSLQKLSISKCNGLSGPLSLWASLVELRIDDCNNLTSIEMKGSVSLTASLQKLTIWDCRELTSLPALPQQCPSLQELMINDCPKLSWFGVKSRRVEEEEEEECISLGQLWIWSCPKLASFCAQNSRIDEEECISLQSTSDMRTMTSLRDLRIGNCERLESWVSSLQFPLSLDTLSIVKIPNLQILPSLDSLNSLSHLEIGRFWEELDSFPDFQVGSLMHLTTLFLYGWPKLKSLPQQIQHLTSLTYLIIVDFEGVETLPEWLGSLTSLTDLLIFHCKNLMNLPSVQAMQRLTKLQILRIVRCHPLLEERCRRGSGTDWPKISHIPDIMIGNF
ncbi:unnamed protein product [Malus baccata var. baccata]